MSFADASDVAARFGKDLTPEETVLVSTRLDDAERMILRRIPDLAVKIANGDVDTEDVVQVEADAVLRLVRNPNGYYSETDGNYTYMFNSAAASGRLEITQNEWTTLGVPSGITQLVPFLAPVAAPLTFAQGG